jgi:hypothetical protein
MFPHEMAKLGVNPTKIFDWYSLDAVLVATPSLAVLNMEMLKQFLPVVFVFVQCWVPTAALARPSTPGRAVQLLDFGIVLPDPVQTETAPLDSVVLDARYEALDRPVVEDLPPLPIASEVDIAGHLRQEFTASQAFVSRDSVSSPGLFQSRSACANPSYRPSGFLGVGIEERRRALYTFVAQAACRHQLPIALLDALIIQESGYDSSARSPVGAYGLAQLMPATAQDLGVNRYSVIANLDGGARYLKSQLDRFIAPHLALAAYNAGPSRVARRWAVPNIAETRNYVARITRIWRNLSRPAIPASFNDPEVYERRAGFFEPAFKRQRSDGLGGLQRTVYLARF